MLDARDWKLDLEARRLILENFLASIAQHQYSYSPLLTSTPQSITFKLEDFIFDMGFLKSKKILGLIIGIVLIFILVPLVLMFVVNPTKQKTTGNVTEKAQTKILTANTELATFNGAPIYVNDLDTLALEQYQTNDAKTLNAVSLDNLLNTYVERKILDKQNLGDVSIEAAKIVKTTGISATQAKYQALREKFTTTAPKSWSFYSIDFWIPPTNADGSFFGGTYPSEQKQTNADRKKLVSDVNGALIFAQAEMKKGTSLFNIATQINKNYPTLSDILAVNEAKFNTSAAASPWNSPTIFYYDKTNAVSDPFSKTVYAMTENSPVTKVLNDNNSGGHVIKIVKINNPNGILGNYSDWLKNQESGLKIINTAILKLESTR